MKSVSVDVKVRNIDPGNISEDFVKGIPALVVEIYEKIGAGFFDGDFWGGLLSVSDSDKTDMLQHLNSITDSELTLVYNEFNKVYQKKEGQTLTQFIDDNAGSVTANGDEVDKLLNRMNSLGLR